MWQPETWVQLLQPIVNFLNQVVQRLGCNTEDQLQQMQQSIASLQQTAQAFKKHGACAGDYGVLNNLGNLDRQADLIIHSGEANGHHKHPSHSMSGNLDRSLART